MLASRRQVLVGAAVVLASGCDPGRDPAPPTARATPTPTDRLLAAAAARERSLLAAYDEVLARHPDLAVRLSPYRADHAAHLLAVEPAAVVSATVAPSARRTPPREQARLRARLRALEEQAAETYARAAAGAPPGHATLLASLAACEASHAELL